MESRIKILFILFLFSFLTILGRLFYWQVIDHRRLAALASRQYDVSRIIPAPRGKIFSHDGSPLVLNTKSYLFFANPQQLKISPVQLKEKLYGLIDLKKLNEQGLPDKRLVWTPLLKNLSEDEKTNIENLRIEGLGFEEQEKRFYPEASMSAQLLGFVGESEEGYQKGYFGLEGYYNQELKGSDGIRYFEKDAAGRPLPLSEEQVEPPLKGRDLTLNIDRGLQFLVESRLLEGLNKYQAVSGSVLVLNPWDGAVMAMAFFPSYAPDKYFNFNPDLYRNPVISSSFEPGSVFKVIIMASALDSRAISYNEQCVTCSGPREISGYTIKTWNEKYFPDSSMTDIIVHSDNVGMVYVGGKLGSNRLYDYLRKFGFGEKTGIDLQGEAVPPLRAKNQWREIDVATASFGQGVAVTPIQLAAAISAVANGGDLISPQVVKELNDSGKIMVNKTLKKERIITKETANMLTKMMVEAVEKGEAKWAQPQGYKIAGKTGTAQIPIAGHYDPEKTIVSFVGFAPADNPKFLMLVTLQEPQTSPWGSETAAPLWFNIAKDIFRLWDIPPNG